MCRITDGVRTSPEPTRLSFRPSRRPLAPPRSPLAARAGPPACPASSVVRNAGRGLPFGVPRYGQDRVLRPAPRVIARAPCHIWNRARWMLRLLSAIKSSSPSSTRSIAPHPRLPSLLPYHRTHPARCPVRIVSPSRPFSTPSASSETRVPRSGAAFAALIPLGLSSLMLARTL